MMRFAAELRGGGCGERIFRFMNASYLIGLAVKIFLLLTQFFAILNPPRSNVDRGGNVFYNSPRKLYKSYYIIHCFRVFASHITPPLYPEHLVRDKIIILPFI